MRNNADNYITFSRDDTHATTKKSSIAERKRGETVSHGHYSRADHFLLRVGEIIVDRDLKLSIFLSREVLDNLIVAFVLKSTRVGTIEFRNREKTKANKQE